MSKGSNRSWGYASSDEKGRLTYTSYEKSGGINRYTDNQDGGHSHQHWNSQKDYNSGKSPDSNRTKSNNSKNPTTGDVQKNGGCYLTAACMSHFQEYFDDNCYELSVLRWFRDNYVSKEDIKLYYEIAPIIVEAIENDDQCEIIYGYIYDNIVDSCVEAIENGDYVFAYNRYKNSILNFREDFTGTKPKNKLVRTITN